MRVYLLEIVFDFDVKVFCLTKERLTSYTLVFFHGLSVILGKNGFVSLATPKVFAIILIDCLPYFYYYLFACQSNAQLLWASKSVGLYVKKKRKKEKKLY